MRSRAWSAVTLPGKPLGPPYFVAAACALTAGAFAIAGAATCPPCALPAAGRLSAAFRRNPPARGLRRLDDSRAALGAEPALFPQPCAGEGSERRASSPRTQLSFRSPGGPVMSTRTPPRKGPRRSRLCTAERGAARRRPPRLPRCAPSRRLRHRGSLPALRPPRGRSPRRRLRPAVAFRGATAAGDDCSGAADFPRRLCLPDRRPPLLRRPDDARAALRAEAALLPGGRRWHRRRRLWFPGSRPSLPLRGSRAPARCGAGDALGRGGSRNGSPRDVRWFMRSPVRFSGPKPTSRE
jgi:hypothetical protein